MNRVLYLEKSSDDFTAFTTGEFRFSVFASAGRLVDRYLAYTQRAILPDCQVPQDYKRA